MGTGPPLLVSLVSLFWMSCCSDLVQFDLSCCSDLVLFVLFAHFRVRLAGLLAGKFCFLTPSPVSDIPQKVRTATVNVQGSVPYSMHYLRMLYFRFVLNSVRDLLRYRCFGTHK